MKADYGRLRKADIPKLESLVRFFGKLQMHCGLHGTSLWNSHYKDVDLLVFSSKSNPTKFLRMLKSFVKSKNGKLLEERGNPLIGYDVDVRLGRTIFHISYVLILL